NWTQENAYSFFGRVSSTAGENPKSLAAVCAHFWNADEDEDQTIKQAILSGLVASGLVKEIVQRRTVYGGGRCARSSDAGRSTRNQERRISESHASRHRTNGVVTCYLGANFGKHRRSENPKTAWRERIDLHGQQVGRLHITGFSHIDNGGNAHWTALCECGRTVTVCGKYLRNYLRGRRPFTSSCGCRKIDEATKTIQ